VSFILPTQNQEENIFILTGNIIYQNPGLSKLLTPSDAHT